MKDVKLLIVDDDEDDFLLARDLLDEITTGPYFLDWASSYEEGREHLRSNVHDLCLMDYKLGARDGIELLGEAQSLGFTGPIILLTGMHQGEVDMQALQAGAVDYLVKASLSAEQLARAIRYALARREMERERVERLKAESENRSKSEFLAHLSHELRTPLSAILGFTELLLNTNKDVESAGHLRVVHRNGQHLLGLLNDILDLSKIEAGKLELEPQQVYLSSFLTDIYFLMRGAAIDKNLDLFMETPSPLPRRIVTDPTRLRQVLLNLIGNAIKFTNHGQVIVRVEMATNDDVEQLHFWVIDSGVGITPKSQMAIFQPFVQAKDSYAPSQAGTGLGLAISRQLVERLGGAIEVTSEPGTGSTFSFYIATGEVPLADREMFTLEFDIERGPLSEAPSLSGRVLVVDDLRDLRMLIGHFVKITGAEVSFAHNGVEALDRIKSSKMQAAPYDLVLMDIHMPVMGGHEAAQNLRLSDQTTPLVALTAAHMKGDMDACLESGFNGYLSKPVDQTQLHGLLQRYLKMAVALPAADAEPASATSKGKNQPVIMVVEDNPDALLATTGLLELLHWRVLGAGCGEEALALLENELPSIILLDANLPDMDGYQLAQSCQLRAPSARLILASGEPLDEVRAKQSGIEFGLLKPLSLAALEQVLN
ncbi:response regulator [Gilvimarinus polysaccharolyticus]|uniref:response regulator n=1 Tax=Gilvimarinus polysaccharolyticus TaxID=863921 RepID=UPI000673C5B8|nr:response regulator [Gilvimarinus polysaccharolyticus]